MCSIFGWTGDVPYQDKLFLLSKASERGRDGCGFWVEGKELRDLSNGEKYRQYLLNSTQLIGNFRATPTTEQETRLDLLQPYEGIVHNGIIANDKDFGNYPIDSMVLPLILTPRGYSSLDYNLQKIKGSYALGYFDQDYLILAVNYKPIYYTQYNQGFMFASTPDMLFRQNSTPIPPYSSMLISNSGEILSRDKLTTFIAKNNKVIVSASGGLDSTTVAYILQDSGYTVDLIHFKYGCVAQEKEVDRVYRIADHGGFNVKFIDMPNVMGGSLVNGDYYHDQIAGTEYAMDWVSARNLLMLAILTAYAETNGYSYIAFGGNLEESGAYPDNEQEFGRRFNNILPFSTQNGVKIELLQPISTLMKHEIVKVGTQLNVPYELTWSCYSDLDYHCNNCGPCFMRKKAFERNGLIDPVFELIK